jgi:hypothetical protein
MGREQDSVSMHKGMHCAISGVLGTYSLRKSCWLRKVRAAGLGP